MSLSIRLLGKPGIERDGVPVPPPRGRKAWGLLAYLVLAERAPSRARLAGLLFAEADDPLGALRWSLAELRRVIDDPLSLRGDPPPLKLPEGAVDVLALTRPRRDDPTPPEWSGGLLEGMDFPGCAAFESWLAYQREELLGAWQSLMHDAALERLAAGDAAEAIDLAERLVTLDPLDQRSQELLIRCLARGAGRARAERHSAAVEELFERELGVSPGPELRLAAGEHDDPALGAAGDRAAAIGQLEAGRAALAAGAVEPGVECLRLASAEAAACGDAALRARALAALGSALVHAVRGRDEEGAAVLTEALALADRTGDRATAGLACRELGFSDLLAGRAASAGRWLGRATELAPSDEEQSAVLGYRGQLLSDRAYYPAALELLQRGIELAERCGERRQAAWSLSMVGRIHLLRGDNGEATAALDRSLDIVAKESWVAFRPWPDALRAEVSLRTGRPDRAAGRLELAFRQACSLGDPCWEGMTARVMGLVRAAEGDWDGAREWLVRARTHVTRLSDTYEWVHAYVLEAMAGVALAARDDGAGELVEALGAIAGRSGMRELVVRAQVHEARLGLREGLDGTRLLAAEIESPALDRLLGEAVPA